MCVEFRSRSNLALYKVLDTILVPLEWLQHCRINLVSSSSTLPISPPPTRFGLTWIPYLPSVLLSDGPLMPPKYPNYPVSTVSLSTIVPQRHINRYYPTGGGEESVHQRRLISLQGDNSSSVFQPKWPTNNVRSYLGSTSGVHLSFMTPD